MVTNNARISITLPREQIAWMDERSKSVSKWISMCIATAIEAEEHEMDQIDIELGKGPKVKSAEELEEERVREIQKTVDEELFILYKTENMQTKS